MYPLRYNTHSTVSINPLFSFLSSKKSRQWESKKRQDEITFTSYTIVGPWLCLSGDFWGKIDSEILCLLWSPNVTNPKYPDIFPDTLSLLYSGPASRPCALGFTLPKRLACLLQTTTSYHRTPAAHYSPQARPLVYPTLMAHNLKPFSVEPNTLQESNLTWRHGEHSHRFHTVKQVKSPQHFSPMQSMYPSPANCYVGLEMCF